MILFLTIFALYICYSVSRFVCCMLQFNLNGQCVFIFSLILITSTFCNICIAAFFQIIHHLFFKNHLAILFLMSQSQLFHFGTYFISLSGFVWLIENPRVNTSGESHAHTVLLYLPLHPLNQWAPDYFNVHAGFNFIVESGWYPVGYYQYNKFLFPSDHVMFFLFY